MRFTRIHVLLRAILLFSVLLSACKNSLKEVVIDTHTDGSPKTIKYIKDDENKTTLIKEVQFYEDGSKRYEGHFKNNQKDGEWTFWFKNGKVWSNGFFKNGIRSGKSKVYYENGTLYYKGNYSDGKKQGIWHFYNKEGHEINRVKYENDSVIDQKIKSADSIE